MRSLVGLDREAATAAFDRYLSDAAFSAKQLRFVQLIVEHLTANGVMEVARLYESPFTDNAPQGPDMIFSEEQVAGIVTVLHKIRAHVLPDLTVA
ncbi:type I site-specific restriction endonuclease [Nocardioides ginsengisegetis]|uniref:Type I site-specific restriction endonuclease n=2 Tax=Nocardioides ginsengisegetis TaxID=661491 RepID=A0A7W3IW56_9ACTN|nr:type I restriction-modification enzyme R subunit C-terminal domain-containing protein [Nocardioides ginsengisegetis]MBA8801772.1 type I site-specific restriction endonuclease [Nocardioides ginsengisegetis]